jgi:hypothetical protein
VQNISESIRGSRGTQGRNLSAVSRDLPPANWQGVVSPGLGTNDGKEKGGARQPEGHKKGTASGESHTKPHHPDQEDKRKRRAEIHLPIYKQRPALQLSFLSPILFKNNTSISARKQKRTPL